MESGGAAFAHKAQKASGESLNPLALAMQHGFARQQFHADSQRGCSGKNEADGGLLIDAAGCD